MQIEQTDSMSFEQALGRQLVALGKLDTSGLERCVRLQQASGARLHVLLTQLGLVSEREMAEFLAAELDLPLVKREDYPDEPLLEEKVSVQFLKEAAVIPLADTPDHLDVAMADPLDGYTIKAMQIVARKAIRVAVATPGEIEAAFDRLYGQGKTAIGQIVEGIGEREDQGTVDDVERLKDLASEAPVIRLANLLIARAVEARASDIHVEPFESKLVVRYRIDGVLREVEAPPSRLCAAVISRIKIMAKLNIAERRLPQDGRIKIAVRGKEIDLRVSVVPTMHGESVVMRILDRGGVTLDLAALGLEGDTSRSYLGILEQPHGVLLITGPTGSGKTTTLYASLLRLNTPEKKIFTVEDPIEYQLAGINQVQIKPQIGLSFAHVLRAILRQDPDIIMIGEIRDRETAEIAVQSALTGHLVLSTLHTNDAASAVTRLLDMGVEDYLLTSTVNGIAAQRLVRTLCRHCREAYEPLPELIAQLGVEERAGTGPPRLFRARGCEHCSGTGYFGRTSIIEVLVMSDGIRRLVLQHAEAREVRRVAVGEGMCTLYADGVRKALAGVTTLEEVLRVTRDQ
jgi:general secretion pathway protein E